MKKMTILAVAGMATSTLAQDGGGATWMSDVELVDEGHAAVVTWSLSMNADAPFVALSATIFDTLNVSGGELGEITSWEVLNNLADLTGDLTTTDGDNLYGTNAGQLTVFGPFTSDNPIDVLKFTFTGEEGLIFNLDGAGAVIEFVTETENVTLWVGDDKDSATAMDVTGSVVEGSAVFYEIPSPAGAALLGLGGLALARRHR